MISLEDETKCENVSFGYFGTCDLHLMSIQSKDEVILKPHLICCPEASLLNLNYPEQQQFIILLLILLLFV